MVRPGAACDPDELNCMLCETLGGSCENVKSATGASVVIVTELVVTPCRPASSVTTSVTAYTPAFRKSCVVIGPEVVFCVPSPKSHAYDRMVRPDPATLADALKFTKSPTSGVDGEVRKLAAGTVPPATSIVCVVLAVRLYWSPTVSVTAYVPAVLNEWVAVCPLPVPPSPNLHE